MNKMLTVFAPLATRAFGVKLGPNLVNRNNN